MDSKSNNLQNQQPEQGMNLMILNNRLRILEERYSTNRERMFVMNQNMIEHYKKINFDISSLNKEMKELKDEIFTIKETVKHLVQELDNFARKEQLKVLEKYINMWNPFNYVTEEEVEKIIERKRSKNVKSKK
ncbi:hypothetical protein HOD61_02010 [archaeon]|jgi:hypothetical protein|nr:hypothetical protein [archaeon]